MWDWVYRTDWQAWATFANAVAIFGAAWIARSTLAGWLKRTVYQKRVDLAERILVAVEEAVDALEDIRNPAQFRYETERARDEIDIENPTPAQITAQVILKRISDQSAKWDSLVKLMGQSAVLFDDEIRKCLRDILGGVREVQSAAQFYARQQGSNEFLERMEHKIWADSEFQNDEPNDTLRNQIISIKEKIYSKLSMFIGRT